MTIQLALFRPDVDEPERWADVTGAPEPEEPAKSFCRNGCGAEIDDPTGPGSQVFFCPACRGSEQSELAELEFISRKAFTGASLVAQAAQRSRSKHDQE